MLALPLAGLLVAAALPSFNRLIGADIRFDARHDGIAILIAVLFTLGVAVLAGSYPAVHLSRFRPIAALRERLSPGTASYRLRQALVIFQFAVSTGLVIGTVLIQRQLDYVRTVDLGLDDEQMLIVYLWGSPVVNSAEAFRSAVLDRPYVSGAALSSNVPMREQASAFGARRDKADDLEMDRILSVDDAFIDTYGMHMREGRTFESTLSESKDIVPVIVNETAASALGALNRGPVTGGRFTLSGVNAEVIGVVEDFHSSSLHERVTPLMLKPAPSSGRGMYYVSIRLDTDDILSSMDDLTDVWKTFAPHHPMDAFFLDEVYEGMYQAEDRLGDIFFVFTGIGLFIACLGLYGLAAFSAEQRTREIGIRKVLGATPAAILRLLSRDFMMLVLIGVVFSVPIAWFGASRWLDDFAYRTSVPAWLFIACGLGAAAIALLAVSYQSLRAASLDPAETLRHE
jgi:putative ABC transport system permease protein